MTNISKRGRGRPSGASRHQVEDRAMLTRVAESLCTEPGLQRTKIMRRLGVNDETTLHRLNRKWREVGDSYIAAARARHRSQADGVRALLEAAGSLQSSVRGIDPAVMVRISTVDQVVRQAAVGLARWAEQNPETVGRIREAGIVANHLQMRFSTGLMQWVKENPELVKAMANPFPAVLAVQRQIGR